MSRRLVVLTEIIAPYRIPVFNALATLDEIDLHVIFLSETDPFTRQWRVYEQEMQFSYEVLPSWRKRIGKYNLLLNHEVANALNRSAPEVIVCGGYNYLASWRALRWAKRNRVQFLLWSESTERDRRNGHFLVESLKRNFFRQCDGFVVPGESARQYLRKFGVAEQNIFVARNAVDIQLFATKEKSIRNAAERLRGELALPERYVLFVGRLVAEKGVVELLNAYASLPARLRSYFSLVFVGDGPLRCDLETAAREIYPGSVHFPGFVHRDELANYYGLAECLVLPTHSDTWGMVVNEAMACGLPVICTSVAGCAADLVQANGRIVEPGNVTQLAEAITEIVTNTSLRREMSRVSAELIQEYSPEACARGIAQAALSSEDAFLA